MSNEGGLVGMGCEAHESKVRARVERLKERRAVRSEGRRMRVKRRKLGKGKVANGDLDEGGDGSGDAAETAEIGNENENQARKRDREVVQDERIAGGGESDEEARYVSSIA